MKYSPIIRGRSALVSKSEGTSSCWGSKKAKSFLELKDRMREKSSSYSRAKYLAHSTFECLHRYSSLKRAFSSFSIREHRVQASKLDSGFGILSFVDRAWVYSRHFFTSSMTSCNTSFSDESSPLAHLIICCSSGDCRAWMTKQLSKRNSFTDWKNAESSW